MSGPALLGAQLATRGFETAKQILTKPVLSTSERTKTRYRYDRQGRVVQVTEEISPRIQVGILGLVVAGVVVVIGVQAARGKISLHLPGIGGGGGPGGIPSPFGPSFAGGAPLAERILLPVTNIPGFPHF